MLSCVFNIRSTVFAMCRRVRVKPAAVFSSWCVVCEGAGHTACGLNVISGKCQEETFNEFVADIRLEQSAFTPYWDPALTFVRLGLRKEAPVSVHVPFESVEEIRSQDLDRRSRRSSPLTFDAPPPFCPRDLFLLLRRQYAIIV